MKKVLEHIHNDIPASKVMIEDVIKDKLKEIDDFLADIGFTESINMHIDPTNHYISLFSRDDDTYFLDYTEWEEDGEDE